MSENNLTTFTKIIILHFCFWKVGTQLGISCLLSEKQNNFQLFINGKENIEVALLFNLVSYLYPSENKIIILADGGDKK